MSSAIEQAFEAIRRMPPVERESLAQAVLALTNGRDDKLDLAAEHLPAVLEGLAQIERGDFVEGDADELVADAFRRRAL